MSYLNRLCIFLAIALLFCLACEKLPDLQPGEFGISIPEDQLSPGDEVTVYFYPDKEGATRFYMFIGREHDPDIRLHLPVEQIGNLLKTTFTIPGDAIGLEAYMEYGKTDVREMSSETYILYDEAGKPIPGSRLWYTELSSVEFSEEQMDSVFQLEFKENPDKLMLYKTRWRWMMYSGNREKIQAELPAVKEKARDYPEGLAALAWVYSYTGQLDSAVAYLEMYYEQAEDPFWAPMAASDISYTAYYKDRMEGKPMDLLVRTVKQFPHSTAAESYINMVVNPKEGDPQPDSLAEWLLAERVEENPKAYHMLAYYRAKVLKDTSLAADAAETYISSVKASKIDTSWSREGVLLAMMYEIASEKKLKTGDLAGALNYAEEAMEVNDEDNYDAELALHAARCAQAATLNDKMNEYIILALAYGGLADLELVIEEFYPGVDPEKQLRSLFQQSAEKCENAPEIEIKCAAGKALATGDYEILVLDFWHPGCSPCIQEMPLLSSFAGEYLDKPEVQWLAVTNTPDDYFKQRPMNFENWVMCNGQQEIFDAFEIGGIPHFFIIDGAGRIRYSQIGAPVKTETAGRILDMLLAELEAKEKLSETAIYGADTDTSSSAD